MCFIQCIFNHISIPSTERNDQYMFGNDELVVSFHLLENWRKTKSIMKKIYREKIHNWLQCYERMNGKMYLYPASWPYTVGSIESLQNSLKKFAINNMSINLSTCIYCRFFVNNNFEGEGCMLFRWGVQW